MDEPQMNDNLNETSIQTKQVFMEVQFMLFIIKRKI